MSLVRSVCILYAALEFCLVHAVRGSALHEVPWMPHYMQLSPPQGQHSAWSKMHPPPSVSESLQFVPESQPLVPKKFEAHSSGIDKASGIPPAAFLAIGKSLRDVATQYDQGSEMPTGGPHWLPTPVGGMEHRRSPIIPIPQHLHRSTSLRFISIAQSRFEYFVNCS